MQDNEERAHARRTDPETSHEAAEKITPQITELQQIVLKELKAWGATTDRKLVTILRAKYGRTESTWRTRRAELVSKGFVDCVGKVDGQRVWQVKEGKEWKASSSTEPSPGALFSSP